MPYKCFGEVVEERTPCYKGGFEGQCYFCSRYFAEYLKAERAPHFPMPAVIGPVLWGCAHNSKCLVSAWVVITDCDEQSDPRLCLEYFPASDTLISDYPHDSPNYR